MNPDQHRSVTFLRNVGVAPETVAVLTRKGDLPLRRVLRQLAELGVPQSMVAELTGVRLADAATVTERQLSRLQTLWALAEAYWDVARKVPGAIEGLDELVLQAKACGVFYDPPACALALIEERAFWVRAEQARRQAADKRRALVRRKKAENVGRPRKYAIDYASAARYYLAGGSLAEEARRCNVSRQQMWAGVKRWLDEHGKEAIARAQPPTPLKNEGEARGLPPQNFHVGSPVFGGNK